MLEDLLGVERALGELGPRLDDIAIVRQESGPP